MLYELSPSAIVKWTRILLGIAAATVAMAYSLYAIRFWPIWPLSDDQQHWGQFGDFVGGTVNPILAFLSFSALLFTIALQTKQLENSARQLEQSAEALRLSQDEIARAGAAQVRAEAELARQSAAAAESARLRSISILLENYRLEIASLRQGAFVASDPRVQRLELLEVRERELQRAIEDLYTSLLNTSVTKET